MFADKNIEKLTNDLLLYVSYIKNMLVFLNKDRTDDTSVWPVWTISNNYEIYGDNVYFIELNDNGVKVNDEIVCFSTKNKTSKDFIRFLNTRFLCDKIWKQFELPKDIINYMQEKYF